MVNDSKRPLPHEEGKEVLIQHDYDFASTVYYKGANFPVFFLKDDSGAFTRIHAPGHQDWYMIVAISKLNNITADRHLITPELVLHYRWAIREGYNHQLDPRLRNAYDNPNNRNTIAGVKGYIEKILKASTINDQP